MYFVSKTIVLEFDDELFYILRGKWARIYMSTGVISDINTDLVGVAIGQLS